MSGIPVCGVQNKLNDIPGSNKNDTGLPPSQLETEYPGLSTKMQLRFGLLFACNAYIMVFLRLLDYAIKY